MSSSKIPTVLSITKTVDNIYSLYCNDFFNLWVKYNYSIEQLNYSYSVNENIPLKNIRYYSNRDWLTLLRHMQFNKKNIYSNTYLSSTTALWGISIFDTQYLICAKFIRIFRLWSKQRFRLWVFTPLVGVYTIFLLYG